MSKAILDGYNLLTQKDKELMNRVVHLLVPCTTHKADELSDVLCSVRERLGTDAANALITAIESE